MSFKAFGMVNFTSETKLPNFIKYLEEGKIMGKRCKRCDKLYFPPRADCANCLSSDMEWVELSGKCKLITYTIAYFAPVGFEKEAPYALAVVELEEGVKALAQLSKDVKLDEVKVGMDLKIVPSKLAGERITYVLKL